MLSRQRLIVAFLVIAILAVISIQFAISIRTVPPQVDGFAPLGTFNEQSKTTRSGPLSEESVNDCSGPDGSSCVKALSRTWEKHSWKTWCSSTAGLVLIKVPKSASSTLAGVVLRIQHRLDCKVHWKHQLAREHAWKAGEVRVAPIRDPTSRALSSLFFHHVSFHGSRHAPSDGFVIGKLKESRSNYILDYTAPPGVDLALLQNATTATTGASWKATMQAIQGVVNFYNFLFVVDRLDESLVVWSWLTDLPFADLITVGSSKQAGSWYSSGGNKCIALAKPVKTPGVQSFIESDQWKTAHAADQLLYLVASSSLDRTIEESMGRARFQRDLGQFRELKNQVRQACVNETYFPCSSTGVPQREKAKESCYTRDFGCGFPCVDRFFDG